MTSAVLPHATRLWNSTCSCFCPDLSVYLRLVATLNEQTACPPAVCRDSGSRVRLPRMNTLFKFIVPLPIIARHFCSMSLADVAISARGSFISLKFLPAVYPVLQDQVFHPAFVLRAGLFAARICWQESAAPRVGYRAGVFPPHAPRSLPARPRV